MNIGTAILIIQLSVGITMLIFGIHEMMRPAQWLKFMPGWMIRMSSMKADTQMRMHSLGNIVFGLFLIFSFGFPLVAAWIAFVWWLSIVPFAWRVDWTIGLRDLSIALSLAALILLL